jgi:hypothetical protein
MKPLTETWYNKQSRYDKIMKLKVKPIYRREEPKPQGHKASKSSLHSLEKSGRSKSKESRLDKIMKLKVHKPKVGSVLKHYQPLKESRRSITRKEASNPILELKKCKEAMRKQEKLIDKEDRLWKVFEKEREMRLKLKERKEGREYSRERSLERRFDNMVQRELKKIQEQKEFNERK